MAIDMDHLAEASELVVRAIGNQIRQAASSTLATSTATSSPTSTSSSATASSTLNNGSGTGTTTAAPSGQSSPLLFFVALGFGVVFTNLWIIVGVKYCFRYNARNRQMRGENGEPITLEQMPTHPRRRRREKKLMSIEEVNEKFPMTKYKSWMMSRVNEGLPMHGGVSVPPSRAHSLREAEGIIPAIKERESIDERPGTSTSIRKEEAEIKPEASEDATTASATQPSATINSTIEASHAEDDEDDDHINAAVPHDIAGSSGDTCAICIDTLEDDDDIRGLTCGHAFHAVCLDPWLTSRRACCPLCKADYYTPKPRPQQAGDASDAAGVQYIPTLNSPNGANMPTRPGVTWIGLRAHGVPMPLRFNARNGGIIMDDTNHRRHMGLFNRPQQAPQMSTGATTTTTVTGGAGEQNSSAVGAGSGPQTSWYSRGPHVPTLRLPRFGRNRDQAATAAMEATPSALEAGTR